MAYVSKMNRTVFASLNFFYTVHFLHSSVGRVLMIASLPGKKSKVHMSSKVRGLDGTVSQAYLALHETLHQVQNI
jgi:hypothetical protein